MNYNDIIVRIAYLTKRNNIKQSELADILGIKKQAINGRAERNSEFTIDEIKAIENYYNIDLSSVDIFVNVNKNQKKSSDNTSNKTIKEKLTDFPLRLIEIQKSSGLSDKDFAQRIELYRDEYLEFKSGDRKPDLNIVNQLKQHFIISLDWLLYGE